MDYRVARGVREGDGERSAVVAKILSFLRRSSFRRHALWGADGEEDVPRDRYNRDPGPLVRGPVSVRRRGLVGSGPQDDPAVCRGGDRGGLRARRTPADEPGRLGAAGQAVVPASDRYPASAGDLAGLR